MDMVMKKLLLLLALLCVATPAIATEHAGSGVTPTLEAGWTGSNFATLHASNVWAKRAYKADPTILANHAYKATIVVTNYSGTGAMTAYVNGIKMMVPSGTYVTSPTLAGATAIPDNFDYSQAIETFATDPREPDSNGSFRFNCNNPFFLPDDPLFFPGERGNSHGHLFWGNTGGNGNSTYKSLRTTGGSNCGDSKTPVNRSLFWHPWLTDGAGHIYRPFRELTYYKQITPMVKECQGAPDATHGGICIGIPNGLRYIWGCTNLATMVGCPSDRDFRFECMDPASYDQPYPGLPGGIFSFTTIDDMRTAGCPAGAVMHLAMGGPQCWDGINLDTPDHHSHVTDTIAGTGVVLQDPADAPYLDASRLGVDVMGKCPTDHPYLIPGFSMQEWYVLDANYAAGHMHLSSDEQMSSSMPAGATMHMDYWEGWSPTAKATWQHYCEDLRNSSNFMNLCNNTRVKGSTTAGSTQQQLVTPITRVGWTRNIRGNGTYVAELRPTSSGELGLYGIGGFTGDVSLSVVDVTPVGKHSGTGVTTN